MAFGHSSRRGGTSGSRIAGQSSANDRLNIAIIVLLALVPLPFGSVHGFSWGAFACFVGIIATVYAVAVVRSGQALHQAIPGMSAMVILFCAFLGYLVVQLLPLGGLGWTLPVTGGQEAGVSSNSISVATSSTFLMLVRQLTYGLFFFLVIQASQRASRRRLLLNAVLVIICGYAVYAIISLQMGDTILTIPKQSYEGSATGPYVNRNSFATLLSLGCVIAVGEIARHLEEQFKRHPHDGHVPGIFSAVAIYGIAYLLLLTVTIATQSRMGLFVALVGTAVVLFVFLAKVSRSAKVVLGFAGAVAIAGLLGLVLFGEAMFNRAIDLERSAEGRWNFYMQILDLIGMRPLTGFGGGSFELAYPIVHTAPVSNDFLWDKAHNTYLALWSELGLIAGSIPLALFALIALVLVRSLLRTDSGWVSQAVALGAIVLCALHSLVDFSLEIQANTFVFLAIVAAGLAATRQPA